jgi:3-oxoacyl-[acyl-carrier protein] reductase
MPLDALASLSRSVAGRVAVVTGAASGMGRSIARVLASEGASVGLVDIDEAGLDETAQQLGPEGGTVARIAADLAEPGSPAAAVDAIRSQLGRIDVLVNNAGLSRPALIAADDYEDAWELTMAVNVTAYVRMLRASLDDLSRDGSGRVVNIASTEGLGATAFISPYTTSKHAVVGLSRALAVELAPRGVTVNCVCPGPIRTAMTAGIPEEAKEKFARRRVPMRRYGDPEEVAHVVLSLVLPAASYVTGAVVPVDGGLTVQNT